jgi:hypothetical protein
MSTHRMVASRRAKRQRRLRTVATHFDYLIIPWGLTRCSVNARLFTKRPAIKSKGRLA